MKQNFKNYEGPPSENKTENANKYENNWILLSFIIM